MDSKSTGTGFETAPSPVPDDSVGSKKRETVLWGVRVGLSVFFIAVFLARVVWPEINDRVDEVALGILALAALPWLGLFVTSLKAFGVEAELREYIEDVAEKADVAQGLADDAIRSAEDLALETSLPSDIEAAAVEGASPLPDSPLPSSVARLAEEYRLLRDTERPGRDRTSKMRGLFLRMRKAFEEGASADSKKLFASAHVGERLAGFALAKAAGDLDINRLTDATLAETEIAFSQYWGLRAMVDTMVQQGTSPDARRTKQLRALLSDPRVTSDPSRVVQIKRVLAIIEDMGKG